MLTARAPTPGPLLKPARTAEAVFTPQTYLNQAQEFYGDLKGRMKRFGREAWQLKVMPGCSHLTMLEKPDEYNAILRRFIT